MFLNKTVRNPCDVEKAIMASDNANAGEFVTLCPFCSSKMKADLSMVGENRKCPHCSKSIQIGPPTTLPWAVKGLTDTLEAMNKSLKRISARAGMIMAIALIAALIKGCEMIFITTPGPPGS